MAKATCSIEGCGEEVIARGWCSKHYTRWHNHGDPETLVGRGRRPPKPPQACSVDGCERPHDSRGYCGMHYNRWLRHGDPLLVLKEHGRNPDAPCSVEGCEEAWRTKGMCARHYRSYMYSQRGECSVEGCAKKWSAKGLCHMHYLRLRNTGTTDDPPETPLRGSCRVDSCPGLVKARDLCGMHLRRWYVYGSTALPMRPRDRKCRFCKQALPADRFTVAANACTECLPLHRAELKRITLPRTKEVRAREAELRAAQGDRCAICGIAEESAPKERLHTDHDHSERGVLGIRGLLCSNCNSGLGHFRDDPERLLAAIRYLQEFAALPRERQLPLFAA